MSIAPLVKTVTVKAPPARAFELFAGQMGRWWPRGKTLGKPHAEIVVEPRAGGGWFERDEEGSVIHWGNVLAWEPPSRLLLAWRLDTSWAYNPDFLTEVELTFEPAPGGGTVVTLEHRNLERFGADAAKHAESLRGGWGGRLGEFAAYANANA